MRYREYYSRLFRRRGWAQRAPILQVRGAITAINAPAVALGTPVPIDIPVGASDAVTRNALEAYARTQPKNAASLYTPPPVPGTPMSRRLMLIVVAVAAVLGIVIVAGLFAHSYGDDSSQQPTAADKQTPQANTTPAGASADISLSDPRVKNLIDRAKHGDFGSDADIRKAAKDAGFNDQQISQVADALSAFVKAAPSATPAAGAVNQPKNPAADQAKNPAADQAAADACNATSDYGHAAADGDKLNKGTCAIVEVDNWSTKTSTIHAGALPQDFVVNDKATPQISGWINYSSTTHACKDAQGQKAAREKNPLFKGFAITVNCSTGTSIDTNKGGNTVPANTGGQPVTGKHLTTTCTAPHTDGIIRSVDNGATAKQGTLVVLRQVDNADGLEWIEYGCLTQDIIAGKIGLVALDLWTGYSSLLKAQSDACGQAIGDVRNAQTAGSWNNMYAVQFLDGNGNFAAPPATCPAR